METQTDLGELLQTSSELLRSRGFVSVADDQQMFSRERPPLAFLKDGRLILGVAAVLPHPGQFFDPVEHDRLRSSLDGLLQENRPDRDQRVTHIEAIAIVQTPDDRWASLPPGDVKWILVECPEELPEEFDRLVYPMGMPGAM